MRLPLPPAVYLSLFISHPPFFSGCLLWQPHPLFILNHNLFYILPCMPFSAPNHIHLFFFFSLFYLFLYKQCDIWYIQHCVRELGHINSAVCMCERACACACLGGKIPTCSDAYSVQQQPITFSFTVQIAVTAYCIYPYMYGNTDDHAIIEHRFVNSGLYKHELGSLQ